jgi:hypothetical protein
MFIAYPKIGQFKQIVQGITAHERYFGKDEQGNPIYDGDKVLPTITFKGTVKIHGTNAGICHKGDHVWFQSRENVITPIKDNAGFACAFSSSEKVAAIHELVNNIRQEHNIDSALTVVLFGEWAGGNIQKNVAMGKLPKRFFLFGIRVVSDEREDDGGYVHDAWLPIENIRNHDIGIYNITDYQTYELVVDLNNAKDVLPVIQEVVEAVEKECPVAKAFGVSGLGEGVVWMTEHAGAIHRFKTKGKEHAVIAPKNKKAASVDTEKLKNVGEFVSYAVTPARLEQGIEKVFVSQGIDPSVSGTGDFIRWVLNDIVEEEIDAISENGLSVKDINSAVAKTSREWLFEYLNRSM